MRDPSSKTFWSGVLAGAALGYVAYKLASKKGPPSAGQAPVKRLLPPTHSLSPLTQDELPKTMHGIPTVPLPAESASRTNKLRPKRPSSEVERLVSGEGSQDNSNDESFGGTNGMGGSGLGGESF